MYLKGLKETNGLLRKMKKLTEQFNEFNGY